CARDSDSREFSFDYW
nr:immunoglobulin heavy chain junction region [Macaca mulatta]MOX62032.1 immunoglobulin heavy chain junction region [Macaca mulatta]MOX62703.1 immunoglobulin heavy chain junction region [Macaca mulatta]MOX65123.1 immunoglobulin heavy chain junction region [Macaca mulatta]MOX65293.1 immunoglobulin heavy chain junction region [Macaca mulatta]